MLRSFFCVVAAFAATACAARGAVGQVELRPPIDSQRSADTRLERFPAKPGTFSVRRLPPRSSVQTVEASDPALSAALFQVMLSPTAKNYRAVADEYLRLGILDMADEYLTIVVRKNPRDASAWHKKARLWRDWGWPHVALPPAIRAVDLTPYSPEMRHTLSTILQALGRHQEARSQYELALRLTPVTGQNSQRQTR